MKRVARPHPLRRFLTLSALLLLFALPSVPASASNPEPEPGAATYAPGQVLITWQPDSGELPSGAPPKGLAADRTSADWRMVVQTLEARTGLSVLEADPYHGLATLAVSPGMEEAEAARLSALPWIQAAEPNYIAYAADTYPNDPYIDRQWNMRRIYAPAAWDLTMGDDTIVVAVVDTGIDYSHPEFAGRRRPGWDYVNDDNDPSDDNGHGTHVSGILAAAAGNGIGVAGLASKVKILPLKVLDSAGSGYYSNIIKAIYAAADYPTKIINLSLQSTQASDILHQAVADVAGQGCLVVAAAGNYGDSGNPVVYPAAYAEGFTVAASDHYDNWASYSGFKPYVDLAAPGGASWDQIWSTVPTSSYDYDYGTSMAAPLVSAAAALVWTYQPAATRQQVTGILKRAADKVGGAYDADGRNDYFGYGRLNIGRAVRLALSPTLSADPGGTQSFLLGGSVQQTGGRVSLINPSEEPVAWQASVQTGGAWLTIPSSSQSGTAAFSAPGSLAFQVNSSTLSAGGYDGLIRVSYNTGASGFDVPVHLRVADALHRAFIPQEAGGYTGANWVDPPAGGQPLTLADNSLVQVSLPFPVSFYGQTYYSSIFVSDNGMALFAADSAAGAFSPTNCVPGAARPNNAFYVLWHDWIPEMGGQVYKHQPDADTFVITWHEVRRTGSSTPHSFQLVLTRDGGVRYQYRTVAAPLEGTIGIENFDGTLAQQVLCNGVGRQVRSGDALLMNPAVPW
jgi:subtilisin family serine protease